MALSIPNTAPIPELYVSFDSAQKLKAEAGELPSWDLTPRQVCDLELLMNGGFNPLKGFLSEADYDGVVEKMRLADGTLWPMPVTLDVSEKFAATVEPGQDIALRDPEGLYRLAREGRIKEVTGISDPYEVPETPELRVGTEGVDVDHCVQQVLLRLEAEGLIAER